MIKRLLIATITVMLAIGFNVVPVQAYTPIGGGSVSVTATGELTGDTATLTVGVVTQASGAAQTKVDFGSGSGFTAEDSGEALKIQGGTNLVNSRVVVYTDNDSYFSTGNDPAVDLLGDPTGIDGSGMPGQSQAGFVVSLYWGVNSAADGDPNINVDYAFSTTRNLDDTLDLNNAVWIVDKRHDLSFTTAGTSLDNDEMYKADGTLVPNTDDDGLYPQLWDEDLYDSAVPATRVLVSEALFKNIATVAFALAKAGSEYTARVPNLTTVSPADNVSAELGPTESLYVNIGGDFFGKPAQIYETAKLNVEMVQD